MAGFVGFPIDGTITSTNIGNDNLIPDIQTMVINYDNDGNPFMSWFSNPNSMALIQTDQKQYYWYENLLDYPNATMYSAISANTTPGGTQQITIDMSNVQVLQVYQHIQTAQSFLVVSVDNVVPNVSALITIKPFPLNGTTAAVANGQLLRSLGVAQPEGGFYPASRGSNPKRLNNIVGIRSYSVGLSRSMINSPTWYDGGPFEYSKNAELVQSKGDCERYYLFSLFADDSYTQNNPNGGSGVTGRLSATDGVYHRITTNVDLYAGTLTEFLMDSFLNLDVFGQRNHGANTKMFLIGPDAMQDINQFAKTRYRIMSPTGDFRGDYGMDVERYSFGGGTSGIFFLEREFMEEEFRHGLMSLDYNHVKLRHKRDNYIEIHPETQQPNQDLMQMSWVFEDGVQLEAELFHARLGWV